MTTFYRSMGSPGLVELWCRCDSCFRSGPFNEFDAFYLKDQELTMCHNNPHCLTVEEWEILRAGGWLSSGRFD